MNENYLKAALAEKTRREISAAWAKLFDGEELNYTFFGDVVNNRKFTLLGDPALTLGYPVHRVSTTAINGVPFGSTPDTFNALSRYTISGEVTRTTGSIAE